jgi:hypothetical protein
MVPFYLEVEVQCRSVLVGQGVLGHRTSPRDHQKVSTLDINLATSCIFNTGQTPQEHSRKFSSVLLGTQSNTNWPNN